MNASQLPDRIQKCIIEAQQKEQQCITSANDQKKSEYTKYIEQVTAMQTQQAMCSTMTAPAQRMQCAASITSIQATMQQQLSKLQADFAAATQACMTSEQNAQALCMSTK